MNGLEAAKMLVHDMGIPVVIYSDDASIKSDVLAAGASFEKKPSHQSFDGTSLKLFAEKIRNIVEKSISTGASSHFTSADFDITEKDHILPGEDFKILCIGASTGGPTAVQEVINGLGSNFSLPVLYTQHIDVGADEKMVRWFNQVCPNLPMHLAKDGMIAKIYQNVFIVSPKNIGVIEE